MRILVTAAVAMAILATPVYAQMGGINAAPGAGISSREDEAKTERERAEIEKQYNETLKRSAGAPAAKSDPWSTVRPAKGADAKR